MDKIFLIDSGHGGMIDGVYQTAPSKMYVHQTGETAYEGVINREVKNILFKLMQPEGLKYIDICPTNLDLSLTVRTDIANVYCKKYGTDNCLLISLHSNAGGGEGFEIWTTRGEDKSDEYAKVFMEVYEKSFPGERVRKEYTESGPDKEADFTILDKSICASILPEWLFFDNYNDFKKMIDPYYQLKYAYMIVDFMKQIRGI